MRLVFENFKLLGGLGLEIFKKKIGPNFFTIIFYAFFTFWLRKNIYRTYLCKKSIHYCTFMPTFLDLKKKQNQKIQKFCTFTELNWVKFEMPIFFWMLNLNPSLIFKKKWKNNFRFFLTHRGEGPFWNFWKFSKNFFPKNK